LGDLLEGSGFKPLPLVIDSDNALGSRAGDVDDGFAIASLLRSGLEVAAIASVAGNTSERSAGRNNRALGALCGYRGRYLDGALARHDGERIDEAWDLWSGARGPVTVLALGPLTNLAAVLEAAVLKGGAGARPAIAEVVLVGGNARSRGRCPPWWPHEFNLTRDRRAAQAVLGSALPLTIVPLDQGRRLRAGRRELAGLAGELGSYLRRHARRWLRRAWLTGRRSFALYDLLAAACVVDADCVTFEESRVEAHANLRLGFGAGARPVRVVRDFDAEGIWGRFRARIKGGPE
jgi:inosine-uridine nucleoside N-ribohydrolase